jgi:hypothetical protein
VKATDMTTAATQYKARQASIRELIAHLEATLTKHELKANADPRNWGYAGDLGRVEVNLQELVDFFA